METTYDMDLLLSSAAASTVPIQAAVPGKQIVVHGLRLTAAGDQTVTIKRGATTLEVFNLTKGVPLVLPLRKRPYFVTGTNEALNATLGAAIQTDGRFETSFA